MPAYCGLRAGELWALRRRDVDLLRGRLTVERALKEINSSAESLTDDKGLVLGPTKTAKSTRSLSIPAPLKAMLEEYLAVPSVADRDGGVLVIRDNEEEGPRFRRSGDPFDADAVLFATRKGCAVRHNLFYKRVFKPAVRAALPAAKAKLRWHDLRHTCASLSLAVTPNLHVVKERLGHDSICTTIDDYGHLVPSVDAALADGLGKLFEEANESDNVRRIRRAEDV